MPTINFQLVTPEREVLAEELVSLSCPTEMGEITILPEHSPLVANLVPGELHAKTASGEHYLYVAGGFVEVRRGNRVIVLADDAEHHFNIDIQKALEAKQRAEQAIKDKALSGPEYARVAAALNQSLVRLRIARKHDRRATPSTAGGVFKE